MPISGGSAGLVKQVAHDTIAANTAVPAGRKVIAVTSNVGVGNVQVYDNDSPAWKNAKTGDGGNISVPNLEITVCELPMSDGSNVRFSIAAAYWYVEWV